MTTTRTEQFKHPIDYLLLEDGSFIMKENGDKLVLEQTGTFTNLWVEQTKN